MDGIKALISSEKAIAAGVLVFISTLFVIIGKMTVEQWNEYTLWALGIYVGGKTVTSVSTTVAGMNKPSVTEASGSIGRTSADVIVGGIGTSPKGRI